MLLDAVDEAKVRISIKTLILDNFQKEGTRLLVHIESDVGVVFLAGLREVPECGKSRDNLDVSKGCKGSINIDFC